MARKVIGILTGLALALILASVLKGVSDYVFAPAALDPSDPVQAGQIMARMPLPGLLLALFSQFVSAVFGGFVGARIARGRWAAWSATALLAAVTLLGQIMAHYPVWLVITTVVLIGAAGWLAGHWAGDLDLEDEEIDDAGDDEISSWTPAPRPTYPSAPEEPAEETSEADAPVESGVEPAPEHDLFDPEPVEPEPEPVITRPRWASFDELRAAAPAPPTTDEDERG